MKRTAAIIISVAALAGCADAYNDGGANGDDGTSVSAATAPSQWVDAWACGPQLVETANLPPAPGLSGNTLRQVVHVAVGGNFLKVQLSNEYGNTAVTMDSVHVAVSRGGNTIDTTTDTRVLFSGSPSVTMQPGQQVFSDGF